MENTKTPVKTISMSSQLQRCPEQHTRHNRAIYHLVPIRCYFAISIDSAIPIITQLVNEGRIVRGFLGIVPVTITRSIARQATLPVNTGIVIARISMDSPAMRAGLLRGDIVVTINDEEIPNAGVLTRVLAKYAPGTEVTIQVLRPGVNNDQPLSAKVTLGKRPDQ